MARWAYLCLTDAQSKGRSAPVGAGMTVARTVQLNWLVKECNWQDPERAGCSEEEPQKPATLMVLLVRTEVFMRNLVARAVLTTVTSEPSSRRALASTERPECGQTTLRPMVRRLILTRAGPPNEREGGGTAE